MKKQIVCFANSRKPGGKCFAGKDIDNKTWIRPISLRQNDSLVDREECIRGNNCNCKICDPIIPELLDIVEIELGGYAGSLHQTENYYISKEKWKKLGKLNKDKIDLFLDSDSSGLWIDGYDSWYRKNDRIPLQDLKSVDNSLKLIEVKQLDLAVVTEGTDFGNPRRKVNGIFNYCGKNYIIPVTDVDIEKEYLYLKEITYTLPSKEKRIILCISMGPEYNGYIYKFISGVMLI